MRRASNVDLGKYDLHHIIIKPLYLGLSMNIVLPAVLIYICHYLNTNEGWYNRIGSFAFTLYIILGVISLLQAGGALLLRNKLLNKPLVKSKETFSEDISSALMKASKPVFFMIMLIAVYGFVYFLLTADFNSTLMMAIFSFLIFQFIRPRLGFVKRLIEKQEQYVEQQQFMAN